MAHHLNLWSKRRIRPDELLGVKQKAPMFLDHESFKKHMRERIEASAKKGGA